LSTLPFPAPPDSSLDFGVLVEAATDIVAVTDVDTTIRYVNAAVERVLGFAPSALIGRRVKELLTPGSVEALEQRLAPIASGRSPSREPRTYEFRARDGSVRHLEVLATDLRSNPRIRGLCVVARDVTDRVLSERERDSLEERQRLAARLVGVGMWEWDVESRSMFADDAVRALLRQNPSQRWTGPEEFTERFVAEDRPRLAEAIRAAVQGPGPGECTVCLALPDGGHRWLYLCGHRAPGSDGRPRILGLVMDVSAQKRAEIELAERRETLELALAAAGLSAWVWIPEQDSLSVDERFAEWVGLPAGPARLTLSEWESLLHPGDREFLGREAADLLEGRKDAFDSAYRLRRPDGGWRWVLDRGRVAERDAAGRALRVHGVALDIDERKRTESELADQRRQLRLALDASRLGLWDWQVDARDLFVDQRYCEIVGTTPEEVRARPDTLERQLQEDDRLRLDGMLESLLAGETDTLEFDARLQRADGSIRIVALRGAVSARRTDGRPARLTGTIADVTEREHTRQLARNSEEIARVGSYSLEVAARRITWSEGGYRIFGLPPGFVPDPEGTMRLVAPGSHARATELFRAAREDGVPFDAELEFLDAAGTPVWVRATGSVESFDGRPVRVFGIVQDIGARKQLERELLEVANREQQRLGSELHDGLGQELTGVSLMLEALAQQLGAAKPALREQLDRLRTLVTHSIQETRALAHGLAPVSLQRGGLEAALRLLTAQVRMSAQADVTLDLRMDSPLRLGEVAGKHVYRIAQEAVANAIRHGRADRIALALRSGPDAVELEVRDDGVGPPDGPESAGLGLRSMRYRAEALGGTLSIKRGEAGGLRVHLRCPQPGDGPAPGSAAEG
jgi:PAS domain S-box-containing protein